ncbi:MAG: hypothetical protein ACYCX4_01935 [Bacillota bacterium]
MGKNLETNAEIKELLGKLVQLGYHEFQVKRILQEAEWQSELDSTTAECSQQNSDHHVIEYLKTQLDFAQKCFLSALRSPVSATSK